MDNDILFILNIWALIILCILALVNNIRMNSITKLWDYDGVKFKKLRNVVNIFNYSRFVYLPMLYFLFKYTGSELYLMLGAFLVLLVQIIVQIVIYRLTTTAKIIKK